MFVQAIIVCKNKYCKDYHGLFLLRGSDWNLANPDYTVRMRIIAIGKRCLIKLEDKNTGVGLKTAALFA